MKKKVENIYSREFEKLTDKFINPLINSDKKIDKQKIIEICHTGKFLMLLDNDTEIFKVQERPDFILKNNAKLFGLEHLIIIDEQSRQREGYFYNIFELAEKIIQQDKSLPNFLATCYLIRNAMFTINQKKELVDLIVTIVKHFVKTNELVKNPIIESISIQPHSQINVGVNLGAWWQKDVTQDIIQSSINKKDKLIDKYKFSKKLIEKWLLLVVGGIGESSYRVDRLENNSKIESKFDRVYILEDFYMNLYRLK